MHLSFRFAATLNRRYTEMQQLNDDNDFSGKVIFRLLGVCTLVLFLFWNPVMLRPRSWNASVVVRSMVIDTASAITQNRPIEIT